MHILNALNLHREIALAGNFRSSVASEDVIYLVKTSRKLLRTYKVRLPIPPTTEFPNTNISGFSIRRSFVSLRTSPKILVIGMIHRNPPSFLYFSLKKPDFAFILARFLSECKIYCIKKFIYRTLIFELKYLYRFDIKKKL